MIPIPPFEMRQLVGPTEERYFDNPAGTPIFPDIASELYESVLDFGCGCGRLARQLLQQTPRPARYLGVDLHAGMIEWCRRNLAPCAPGFEFHHHDVHNLGLNPAGKAQVLPFPAPARSASLVLAWSVFTHVSEAQALFYLAEVGRVLREDGLALTTWFLFDKRLFPMMQPFQNAIFINDVDPTNAVIFDRVWMRAAVERAGLGIVQATPPSIRGYQWTVKLVRRSPGFVDVPFPEDLAPLGSMPPPLMPPNAEKLGLP